MLSLVLIIYTFFICSYMIYPKNFSQLHIRLHLIDVKNKNSSFVFLLINNGQVNNNTQEKFYL